MYPKEYAKIQLGIISTIIPHSNCTFQLFFSTVLIKISAFVQLYVCLDCFFTQISKLYDSNLFFCHL